MKRKKMKIDIETLRGMDPTKTYVVEVKKKSMIKPARDAFMQLGVNVLVVTKGSIKIIEPKERTADRGVGENQLTTMPPPKKVTPMPPPEIGGIATIRKGLDKIPTEDK